MIKAKQIIFILSLFVWVNASCKSTIDSLKQALAFAYKDVERYEINRQLSHEFLKGGSDSAIYFAQEALVLGEKLEDREKILTAKYDIAGSFYRIGNYNRCIQIYYDILKFLEDEENLDVGIYSVSFNIGLMYEKVGNYQKAREYYQKALDYTKKYLADSVDHKFVSLGRVYNNIGVTYLSEKNYEKALEYFNWVVNYYKEAGDSVALKYVYNNFGLYYNEIGRCDTAFVFYNKSLKIRKREKDNHGIALTQIYIGECYSIQNNFSQAQQNFETALNISKQYGYIDIMQMAAENLTEVYKAMEAYKKSNDMHVLYKQISDSLNIVESARIASMLEMQYNFDKYQQQVKLQRQKTKYRLLLAILALSLFSIIASLLFFLNRSKLYRIGLEKEKVELERKSLSDELVFKNKELASKLMYLIGKNELINHVSTHLHKNLSNFKKANQEFIFDIIKQMNDSTENEMWEEFEIRFRDVNENFYKVLLEKFPNLSTNEKKLCAFLKLNMSTKDISAITHQTQHTINIARSRLRKKLGIDNQDVSLNDFLIRLETEG